MKNWLRRIRGAIGIGLMWAFAWFAAGMILLLIVGPDAADVPFPLGFGMLGFFAGASFSVVLGAVEGRRSFEQMSIPRFAGWGALGGLLLSGAFVSIVALLGAGSLEVVVLGPVFAIAGAASAAGTLALARMARDQDGLGPADDFQELGLTDEEKRELLGDGG
jgi:hypothetical protein